MFVSVAQAGWFEDFQKVLCFRICVRMNVVEQTRLVF